MIIKAITLWQPWASLIIDGRKTIETRSYAWWFRGDVAVHAGRTIDREACIEFDYDPKKIPSGAVLGLVEKYDCVQFPSALAKPDEYGDFARGRYGWLLRDVRAFITPIPAKGSQGPWEWLLPESVVYRK